MEANVKYCAQAACTECLGTEFRILIHQCCGKATPFCSKCGTEWETNRIVEAFDALRHSAVEGAGNVAADLGEAQTGADLTEEIPQ